MNDSKIKFSGLSLGFSMFAVLLWQALCYTKQVPPFLLPSPLEILNSYQLDFKDYEAAFFSTAFNVILGISLSFIFASLLSLIFLWSELVKKALLPICLFFQTVPLIAIAPIMVIWLGFGRPTVVASSLIVSFFPILANLSLGFQQVSKSSTELFQIYRASRLQTLLKLQIPTALPSLFAGLEIAVGLSIVGAIVGEFIAGGGLGGLIDSARTQQKIEMVFGAVLLSSLLGGILISLLRKLRHVLIRG